LRLTLTLQITLLFMKLCLNRIKRLLVACMLLASSATSFAQISQTDINNATDIINGIGDLLQEDEPDPASVAAAKAANDAAYASAAETARKNKELAEWVYKRDYLNKYLESAQKGNALSRMQLVYGLYNAQKSYCHCSLGYLVPDWESWMKEGVKEKNFNAVNFIGYNALYPYYGYNLQLTPAQGLQILEGSANSQAPNSGYLGTQLRTITAAFAQEKDIDSMPGAYVNMVVVKSAAEAAGLQVGDIVIKNQDKPVMNADELLRAIGKQNAGSTIQLTILRNGKEMAVSATLKKRPGAASRTDALMLLADYYNMRRVGENPDKALAYYTKAAEDGSPSAMYNLGKIYLYGITGDKAYFVRYKVERDETTAFNWFLKSIEDTHFVESLFQQNTKCGSRFVDDSFQELIKMYNKGIGCEKSEAKANELQRVFDDLLLERKLND
jgi:TPR repeat protein